MVHRVVRVVHRAVRVVRRAVRWWLGDSWWSVCMYMGVQGHDRDQTPPLRGGWETGLGWRDAGVLHHGAATWYECGAWHIAAGVYMHVRWATDIHAVQAVQAVQMVKAVWYMQYM